MSEEFDYLSKVELSFSGSKKSAVIVVDSSVDFNKIANQFKECGGYVHIDTYNKYFTHFFSKDIKEYCTKLTYTYDSHTINNFHESNWRDIWFNYLSSLFDKLNELDKNNSCFVLKLYHNCFSNEKYFRGILQDLIEIIARKQKFGLIIITDTTTVDYVIKQNKLQFLEKHKKYNITHC